MAVACRSNHTRRMEVVADAATCGAGAGLAWADDGVDGCIGCVAGMAGCTDARRHGRNACRHAGLSDGERGGRWAGIWLGRAGVAAFARGGLTEALQCSGQNFGHAVAHL